MKTDTPKPAHLLMYGREDTLLDTRRQILVKAGFAVDATMALHGVKAQLAANPAYGLLIVCHTAPAEDRRALAALAEGATVPVFQIEALITPTDLLAVVSAVKH